MAELQSRIIFPEGKTDNGGRRAGVAGRSFPRKRESWVSTFSLAKPASTALSLVARLVPYLLLDARGQSEQTALSTRVCVIALPTLSFRAERGISL